MTPLDFARNLARSPERNDRVLGLGIATRGLTDNDPHTLRQGWPLDRTTVLAAAKLLGIGPVDAENLADDVIATAPSISDYMLNLTRR